MLFLATGGSLGYFSFVLHPNSLALARLSLYNQLSDARGNVSLAASRRCRDRKSLFDNSQIGTEVDWKCAHRDRLVQRGVRIAAPKTV